MLERNLSKLKTLFPILVIVVFLFFPNKTLGCSSSCGSGFYCPASKSTSYMSGCTASCQQAWSTGTQTCCDGVNCVTTTGFNAKSCVRGDFTCWEVAAASRIGEGCCASSPTVTCTSEACACSGTTYYCYKCCNGGSGTFTCSNSSYPVGSYTLWQTNSSNCCSCSWNTGTCGGGTCAANQRYQTRTCSPTSCSGHGDTRCTTDSSCCTGCTCTPTCGGSYPLSSCSGPGCSSGSRSCNNVNSCGALCGGTTSITCYSCTVPSAPATPTNTYMQINSTEYNLSTNSSSPTIIDYRSGGTVKVYSNSTTTNYRYNAYNAYSGGSLILDYSGTTQVQPSSGNLIFSQTGRFEASHYNFRCPDNLRNYSGTRTGYYCMETNNPPPTPSSISLSVDGNATSLSSNIASPTTVRLACNDNNTLYVPTLPLPSGSRAVGYVYSGSGGSYEGSTAVKSFVPTSNLRPEGATGSVTGSYYTLDFCTDNRLYSPSTRTGYYRVETNQPLSGPTSISMSVHDLNYIPLSTNPASPTEVRIPCVDNAVDLTLPFVDIPETAFRRMYIFNPDGIGEIQTPFSSRIVTYPNPRPKMIEGATGSIVGYYRTTNRCDLNPKNSVNSTTGYYRVHVNEPVSGPSSVSMIVDGEIFSLETDTSNPPTKVKYPSTMDNVQTRLPVRSMNTSTAFELGYRFEANNWGLEEEGVYEWPEFACNRPEDYCSEEAHQPLQDFNPFSMNTLDVLKGGAEGRIDGRYYTTNLCNENKKYSEDPDRVSGYYKVNNIPFIIPPPEEPDPDDPIPWEPDPNDPSTWLMFAGDPLIVESNCTASDNHTGFEANNPITVKMRARDLDGNDEVRGLVLYFTMGTGEPKDFPSIIDPPPGENQTTNDFNSFGIMIKNGTTPDQPWDAPKVYGTDNNGNWAQAGTLIPGDSLLMHPPAIRNAGNETVVRIISFAEPEFIGDTDIQFELQLEFVLQGTYLNGTYEISAMVFDEYMMMDVSKDGQKDTLDQTHFKLQPSFLSWTFDLEAPVVEVNLPSVIDSRTVLLTLIQLQDYGISGLRGTVLDAYRGLSPGSELDILTLESPTGYGDIIPLTENVLQERIGHIGDPSDPDLPEVKYTWGNGWFFEQPTWPDVRLNINNNELGDVFLNVTAYDNSCNKSSTQPEFFIDLKPWIATKGGVMYSGGDFGSAAKDLNATGGTPYIITPGSPPLLTLRGYTLDDILTRMTTGTELVSTRENIITSILYADRDVGRVEAVRALQVRSEIDKEGYWFKRLSEQLERQILLGGLTEFSYTGAFYEVNQMCSQDNCFTLVTGEAAESDIVIPSGFICDKKTLFMTEGNIVIQPDVTNGGLDNVGCIFVAQGDITIEAGDHASQGRSIVHYDYIQGYMIADGQIYIKLVDREESVRDGLEIDGGLLAFGQGVEDEANSSAIELRRNLRLLTLTNPVLVTTWDVRYAKISEIFFGKEAHLYKQEVGFKVF